MAIRTFLEWSFGLSLVAIFALLMHGILLSDGFVVGAGFLLRVTTLRTTASLFSRLILMMAGDTFFFHITRMLGMTEGDHLFGRFENDDILDFRSGCVSSHGNKRARKYECT